MLNFGYLVYLIAVRPLEMPNANLMEIFNEGMILMTNYHLFLFHFFDEDPVSAYNVGFSCIGVMMIMIFVNVVVVLVKTIRDLYFFIRRIVLRCK